MAEPNLLKDCGVDFLSVVVDRDDVEKLYVDNAFNILRKLLQDRQTVVTFRGGLDIGFAGYDNDARELYEIGEVRKFLSLLDKKFPFWLYFLNLKSGALVLILLSLCQYSKDQNGTLAVDRSDEEKFFVEHGQAVDWLFETYSLDEKEYEVLPMQITNYLRQRRHPPSVH